MPLLSFKQKQNKMHHEKKEYISVKDIGFSSMRRFQYIHTPKIPKIPKIPLNKLDGIHIISPRKKN